MGLMEKKTYFLVKEDRDKRTRIDKLEIKFKGKTRESVLSSFFQKTPGKVHVTFTYRNLILEI